MTNDNNPTQEMAEQIMGGEVVELSELDYECLKQPYNDYGNARRLFLRHGQNLSF